MTTTVALPLSADHAQAVLTIRRQLGLSLPGGEAWPHISVVVVLGGATPDQLARAVAEVAATTPPVQTRARGLGLFLGRGDDETALYVPVVRTDPLTRLHGAVAAAARACGATIEGQHEPVSWLPHITLAHAPLRPAEVGALVTSLAGLPGVSWHLALRGLVVLDGPGAERCYRLAG